MMSEVCTIEAGEQGCANLTGALTFKSTPGLYRESENLFKGPAPVLSVDLSGVTSVDSAGLALLLEWQAVQRTDSRSLHILNRITVRRIRHAADSMLQFHDSASKTTRERRNSALPGNKPILTHASIQRTTSRPVTSRTHPLPSRPTLAGKNRMALRNPNRGRSTGTPPEPHVRRRRVRIRRANLLPGNRRHVGPGRSTTALTLRPLSATLTSRQLPSTPVSPDTTSAPRLLLAHPSHRTHCPHTTGLP